VAKKDTASEPQNHQGSVAPEDKDLTLWIDRLWSRGEPPARVEVWQVFGRNDLVRGEMIFHEDFNPKDKRDIEHNNKLANEILSACQHDCDSKHRPKPASYQLSVVDRNRTASPLVRRIGPLQPKRSYALAIPGDPDSNGDDEPLDIRSIELAQIKAGFEEVRHDKNRNDRILGDVLLLLRDNVIESRQDNRHLMGQVMDMFSRLQEADDRRLEREIRLEKERFNLVMKKELMRGARNLIPGFFSKDDAPAQSIIPSNGHANGNGNGQAAQVDHGKSSERTLIDNFLNDIEEEGEELNIKLFGDFEERDGKMVQITPGVFRFPQYRLLVGVRDGKLPVSAVDVLLPESGHENAITMEQLTGASDAGVSEGTALAILELVKLRRAARDAAPPPSTPPTNPEATT
jgi:hypothetical protein